MGQPILEALHKEVQDLQAKLAVSDSAKDTAAAEVDRLCSRVQCMEAAQAEQEPKVPCVPSKDVDELRRSLEMAEQALEHGGRKTLLVAVEELQCQRTELREQLALESQARQQAEIEHLRTLATFNDANRLHMVSVERKRLKPRRARDRATPNGFAL